LSSSAIGESLRSAMRRGWIVLVLVLSTCGLMGCKAAVESSGGAAGEGGAPHAGTSGASAGSAGGGQGGSDARAGQSGSAGRAGAAGQAGRSGGGRGGAGAGGASGAGGAAAAGNGGSAGGLADTCAQRAYLICEDFEDAAASAMPPAGWSKHGDASSVASDAAAHGMRSLKLGAIPTWERRIYHDASALGPSHWGRIYFKVQQPVPDAFVHSTLVALGGDGPTRGRSEFRVVDTVKQAKDTRDVGSKIQFLWNVQPQSSDEFGHGTSYDWMFEDRWRCAEWHIDAATQSYAFYLDGEQLIDLENGAGKYEGTDIPQSFSEVRVGWINYQDSPPGFTAWIDDIALDDERIGCL
jgi:hypothetical protein